MNVSNGTAYMENIAPMHADLSKSADLSVDTAQRICTAVESHVGRIPFSSRYHRQPRKLQEDFAMLSDILGSGSNGSVTLATSKTNPQEKFAVKTVQISDSSSHDSDSAISEVQTYLCLDHPHIASLHAVYETEKHLHLVMECLEGGELLDRLREKRRFSETEARDALRQMLLALNYMHSHEMVHRDVKLENFVYDRRDGNHLKLIDFGFSTMWTPRSTKKMSDCLGTVAYVAPDVLAKSYTSKCDLWSLGVVAFALLSGRMPFFGSHAVQRQNIATGTYAMRPKDWGSVSSGARDFARSLLNVNSITRLSAQQALKHHWIANTPPSPQSSLTNVAHSLHQFRHLSVFRRRCMKVLALSLPQQDRTKFRESFMSLNTSQMGTITLTEFRRFMIENLPVTDESEIRKSFDALDYNRDREIHYSDFLAAITSTMIYTESSSLRSAFKAFDNDGSGYITTCKLAEVLGYSDEETVHAHIKEVDTQNMGCICLADFVNFVTNETPKQMAADHNPHWQNRPETSIRTTERTSLIRIAMGSVSAMTCITNYIDSVLGCLV